jgi:hypothetical protein
MRSGAGSSFRSGGKVVPTVRRLQVLLLFSGLVILVGYTVHLALRRMDGKPTLEQVSPVGEGIPIQLAKPGAPPDAIPPPGPLGDPEPEAGVFDLGSLDRDDFTATVSAPGLAHFFRELRNDPSWSREAVPGDRTHSIELWDSLLRQPTRHRGAVIALEGDLISSERNRSPLELAVLPPGNPSGLDRYYQAFVFTGDKLYMVATWRPPDRLWSDHDGVKARGRFLQVYTYEVEVRGRRGTASVPVIVAESFVPVDAPERQLGLLDSLKFFAAILGAAFLVTLIAVRWILKGGDSRSGRRRPAISRRREAPEPGSPASAAGLPPAGAGPGEGNP